MTDTTTAPAVRPLVEVEVWSDVVCPWCYIGKRRFERAVDALRDEIDVVVRYRPYQLDPRAPLRTSSPAVDGYAKKFGGEERAMQIIDHVTRVAADDGIEFHLDQARRVNTLPAHRLLWVSEPTGLQGVLKERLLQAYFTDATDLSDLDVLADLAAEVGLPRDRVREFLDSDDGTAEVGALLTAAAEHDITGVPTYVFTRFGWAVPGAQDPELFERILRRVAEMVTDADAPATATGAPS
jgi:predicted DsbA family dithiol-disulfide isomerase